MIEWLAQTQNHPKLLLHRDVERGGVKVDTGVDEKTGLLISRISLASARASDTGNYTCRLGGVPEAVLKNYPRLQDTIVVHVLDGDITKAIHHSSQGQKVVAFSQMLLLLLFLWLFSLL